MDFGLDYLGDVKVLAKWQIVIPKYIRDKLNIVSGDSLKIMLRNDGAIGIMREEDLTKTLEDFNEVDFDKQESVDVMKNMQWQMDQVMKHLNIQK